MSESGYCITACQHCGGNIEFPQAGVGRTVPCPHCDLETILAEPMAEPSEAPAANEITAAELKAALAGIVPSGRVSIFYQLGLALVALFMVLLPVVYLVFVAALAYATYWYGVHARVLFANFIGGIYVTIFKLILYIGPLIGGGIAVFFMFKPIFARPPRRAEAMELNPAQHPRLYQFIAHLCDMLQVRVPKKICLNAELNAGAGLRRGLWSFFGNDLVLELGLPLVAGFNTRQLAGVVAHELGHCRQAFAMRLGYLIQSVDHWFVRVVYERDSWDVAFQEWADSVNDWRLAIIVVCAQAAVWCSRRILALLLILGHAVSCFLSRQMEYNADACATAVAGSAGTESMLLRLRELAVLHGLAMNSIGGGWKKRHQLPDNLPEFLQRLEAQAPPNFHEQARLTLLNETAPWFATHPTAAQRIGKARQQAMEGLFTMEKPSRWLFGDFEKTAKAVTARFYRQDLRLGVMDAMLRPVEEFFTAPPRG